MAGQILPSKTEKVRFQNSLLSPLLTGENITAIFVPHGGRKKSMVYLQENARKFNFQKLGKYQICFLDKNELTDETPEAYYWLILKSLDSQNLPSRPLGKEGLFSLLQSRIKELVAKNYHLIFILGYFDQLNFPTYFYNNLRSLEEIDKTKIHFIFATAKDIFSDGDLSCYGQLKEVISQNLVYFPLFLPTDAEFVASSLCRKYNYRLSTEKQKLSAQLSGGHPALIKVCLRVLHAHPELKGEQLTEFLLQELEIKVILEDIWNALSENDKNFLVLIAQGNLPKTKKPSDFLLNLRIVSPVKNSGHTIFSPIFGAFIQSHKDEGPKLTLDTKTGEVLVNGILPKKELTLQEYHLMAAFLKSPKKLLSRDEIADILWGKQSSEKYSDWAIDQAISQLRKSLEQMSVPPKNLQTIRGRGYRWVG